MLKITKKIDIPQTEYLFFFMPKLFLLSFLDVVE